MITLITLITLIITAQHIEITPLLRLLRFYARASYT